MSFAYKAAGIAAATLFLSSIAAGAQSFEQPTVSQTIVNGATQTITDIPWSPGQTPLDVLQLTGRQYGATWFPSFGQYQVVAIDGAEQAEPDYWQVCIDDVLSPVGAGSYVLAPGAQIEWVLSSDADPC